MEKGEMRVEANISVSGDKKLGTKVEVKNLNSFRSVERAIAFEVKRQIKLLEKGGEVMQETRGWDEAKQETFSQRKKESSHDYRLPELFCGFRRRGSEPPIPYEVACKPQAWAAGSVFLMLKSILGLSTDVDLSYLVFNSPVLTKKMNYLEIKNLRGRDWEIDFMVRRAQTGTLLEVTRKVGNPRILTVKS
jgi:hypothetical protein